MESLLKADDKKLNEYLLLSNGKFNIPYTQRPYEWSSSQVERLFGDIIALYEGKKEQHILNFITIYLENDHQNIFDGQQRTVTLLIFICAIIHKIESLGEKDLSNKLKEEFIKKEDWRSSSANNSKIIFGKKETNEFFENYIIENNLNYDYTPTDYEKNLKRNYDNLKSLIDEYYRINRLTIRDLSGIVEAMTEKMYVIILETPNEDIANQMFETLNNTGKKLVDFYVLKNKCIKVTSEDTTSKYWDVIEANTDLLNKNQFLSQFVSLYNGKTSSQKAFEILEKQGLLNNPEQVENLLYNMQKVSKYFLELHEPNQRKRNEDNQQDLKVYNKLVEGLKIFGAIQYRPIILAMNFKNYALNDINKILKICLTIQIRNIFFAKQKANTLESFYPDLAKKIFTSDDFILDSITDDLKNKIISNEQTIVAIKNREIKYSENKIIRYILRNIYDFENNREITINNDAQFVNLEHILPQNPKDDSTWLKIFANDLKEYIYKLGNLTLILGKKNSDLGNKEFNEKRLQLKESKISQNVNIASNNSWTRLEIDNRTEELAKKILELWPNT
ncbi:DUF262 domain-containing HNH endonuclease family protein [Mammaliicoccus sciuri]|uniref:DUF262 domain-containing protein n=1 Tax=Mammaliicoccus sciuri TaxID=1296 RepID=UPI000BBE9BB7|nr:DUF262 domain-containing protein [Mammaliicoccus sciuri]PCM41061.1 hypothetical protein CPU09_06660 [Mammaliicoccus sciuri]UXU78104.1 DUF262 domain-containing HNH endonuclease family protein [Mammaliicoccus sciuri]